jgi:hypothetical protein
MAQKQLKKPSAAISALIKRKKPVQNKPGTHNIYRHHCLHVCIAFVGKKPSQNASMVQQGKKLNQKLSAQITRNIEEIMAVRANAVGKLTIMKKVAEQAKLKQKDTKKSKQ